MHVRACSRKGSSPSFMLIELTIGLPGTHFSPASITLHFELSIITGTRAISGSAAMRSEEHTSELQSLMRISYAVFCLKKKKNHTIITRNREANHSNTFTTSQQITNLPP